MLGRKGRSLKCATCGLSWFQAAVVDEIDLADVLAESKAKETASEMGGGTGGSRVPDTAAIAAITNQALGQSVTASPPPEQGATGGPAAAGAPDAVGGAGASGGPGAAPMTGQSMLDRGNEQQPPPVAGQSMLDEGGAMRGPQAAPAATSLKGEDALTNASGDEALSWLEKEKSDGFEQQVAPDRGWRVWRSR